MRINPSGIVWVCCAVLAIGACGLSEEDMHRREWQRLTGVPFPSPLPSFTKENAGFGEPMIRYYLRTYERQDGAKHWLDDQDCTAFEFRKGLFADMPVPVEPMAKHVGLEQELCYRVLAQTRSTRAVFIQGNKLFYYFHVHLPKPVKEETQGSETHRSS